MPYHPGMNFIGDFSGGYLVFSGDVYSWVAVENAAIRLMRARGGFAVVEIDGTEDGILVAGVAVPADYNGRRVPVEHGEL